MLVKICYETRVRVVSGHWPTAKELLGLLLFFFLLFTFWFIFSFKWNIIWEIFGWLGLWTSDHLLHCPSLYQLSYSGTDELRANKCFIQMFWKPIEQKFFKPSRQHWTSIGRHSCSPWARKFLPSLSSSWQSWPGICRPTSCEPTSSGSRPRSRSVEASGRKVCIGWVGEQLPAIRPFSCTLKYQK